MDYGHFVPLDFVPSPARYRIFIVRESLGMEPELNPWRINAKYRVGTLWTKEKPQLIAWGNIDNLAQRFNRPVLEWLEHISSHCQEHGSSAIVSLAELDPIPDFITHAIHVRSEAENFVRCTVLKDPFEAVGIQFFIRGHRGDIKFDAVEFLPVDGSPPENGY